jgi:hypothetical protein
MRLTLLSTGIEVDVPMPLEKKGKDRMVQSFERTNKACSLTPLSAIAEVSPVRSGLRRWYTTPLSATDSGAQVSTSPNPVANPRPIDSAPEMSADALAQIVYGMMEEDVVGDKVRAEIRRRVSRVVNEAWNEDQKRRPGSRTAAEYAKFRADIDNGTEAAVKAYARLRLGTPTALQVDIAGSRANPINRS